MIHPVLYEEYKQLHDERAERLQREAQVHAWLRGRPSQWTALRLWVSELLSRSGSTLKTRSAGSSEAGAVAPS
jgi:hypothetical protein